MGQKNVTQENFPKLKTIGGDLHLALSGFTKLPDSLHSVEGDVFIVHEPKSLVISCLEKKTLGIIKGSVYLVGGGITHRENGIIEYTEKVKLNIK